MTTATTVTAEASRQEKSLRSRAMAATAWWMSAYVLQQFIRVGSNVWLAYLLFPRAFGLVSLATVVIQGLKMISEVGIHAAIVQNKREDEDFLNTAWTMQAGRGVLLWLTSGLLAFPAAKLYGEPGLIWLVPAVGLSHLLGGFNSTTYFVLNRSLAEGKRALLELSQAVTTRGAMIAIALIWPTPWALVGGTLIGAVWFLVLSHTWLGGHRHRFRWEPEAARSLFRFGTWIFIGTVIAFLGQQLDKLMLPRLEEVALLGVYTLALTVAKLPAEVTSVVASHVLYTVLANFARERPEEYARQVCRIRAAIMPVGILCVMGVVLGAPWFFTLLFDERYADAAWMAPLAAAAVWFSILTASANKALLATAQTRPLALSGLVQVVGTAVACLGGYYLLGVPGFVVGTAVGTLAGHIVLQVAMARRGMGILWQDASYSALLAGVAVVGVGGVELIERTLAGPESTVASIAYSCLLLAGVGAWVARRLLPMVWKR